MLINLVYYIDRNLPDDAAMVAWIELDGKENEQRLLAALNNHISGKIQIRSLPLKITSPDNGQITAKLARLFAKLFIHPRYMKRLGISAVVILGGDDISEYYKKWMIITDLIRIRIYSKGFKTLLAGQTIGPFKGMRRKLAAWCLAGTTIFCRDTMTVDYLLNKLKFSKERLFESADLAFADIPGQFASAPLRNYGLIQGRYICIVPGGFFKLYTDDQETYVRCWIELVKALLRSGPATGKKIVLLPHVTRPEDDRMIISGIRDHVERSDDLVIISEELLPGELRRILGNCYFAISSRMHASISAFQMGSPALSIGFSVKYHGVTGQALQCQELVIESSKQLFEDPGMFTEKVIDKVNYIQNNHKMLTDKINRMIPDLKMKAVSQVNRITEILLS